MEEITLTRVTHMSGINVQAYDSNGTRKWWRANEGKITLACEIETPLSDNGKQSISHPLIIP
jgi:hypothetical protein